MLSSVSSVELDWHRRAHLQSLAMVCLGSSSALGKTSPAARAGFAEVQVASYQLLPAAKYVACRQLPGGKDGQKEGRGRTHLGSEALNNHVMVSDQPATKHSNPRH